MGQHIEQVSAAAAMDRTRKNEFRKYPTPERDGDRLYPFAAPQSRPSFRIEKQDTIFAVGSCFARRIETSLQGIGNSVLSAEFDLGPIGQTANFTPNIFNKYSIHSITNELRWAVERDTFPGVDLFYRVGNGAYADCQLGLPRIEFPTGQILEFRNRCLDVMARIVEADVVIVTLGYVETWFDHELGLYLNTAPPVSMVNADPDRFEFRVLSYSDVLEALEEFYALLLKYRTKPLKMLITVSPVPLITTFREMDVLTANAYSKAAQRAAIDEFLIGKEGVDYFPSYEAVTLSDPNVAWSRGDYRHVSPELVDKIMSRVLNNYVAGFEGHSAAGELFNRLANVRASLRKLVDTKQYQEAVDLVGQNREIADSNTDILLLEASSLRGVNLLPEAWTALTRAAALSPGRPMPLERMILLCRHIGRRDEAKVMLAEHARKFPAREEWRLKQDWIHAPAPRLAGHKAE